MSIYIFEPFSCWLAKILRICSSLYSFGNPLGPREKINLNLVSAHTQIAFVNKLAFYIFGRHCQKCDRMCLNEIFHFTWPSNFQKNVHVALTIIMNAFLYELSFCKKCGTSVKYVIVLKSRNLRQKLTSYNFLPEGSNANWILDLVTEFDWPMM